MGTIQRLDAGSGAAAEARCSQGLFLPNSGQGRASGHLIVGGAIDSEEGIQWFDMDVQVGWINNWSFATELTGRNDDLHRGQQCLISAFLTHGAGAYDMIMGSIREILLLQRPAMNDQCGQHYEFYDGFEHRS